MKQVTIISRLPYRRMNGVARYLMCITSHPNPQQYDIDLRMCEWGREHEAKAWHSGFFPDKTQRVRRIHHWHNDHILPWAVKRSKADLIHVTFNGLPEKWHVGDVPYVLTLHGSAPFHAHEWGVNSSRGEYTHDRLRDGWSKISKIITCSNWSKHELMTNYGLSEDVITVQHHGVDLSKFRRLPDQQQVADSLNRKFGIKSPFLLNVGASAPRKNVVGLVKAFGAFKAKHKTPHKLVLAGPKGAQINEVKAEIDKQHLKEDVILTSTISDEVLIELYNAATALVFPSFYEGFGYPIVEAMACGLPVITSNITSMPEVGGNAADYVDDPHDVDQITAAIERVVLDENRMEELIKLGFERVRGFSWQVSAENHLKLYQSLL